MHWKNLAAVSLVAVAGLAFGQAKDDPAELKKFEGSWVLVSGKKDGQPIAGESVSKSKISWKGKETALETPHQSKEAMKATVTLGAAGAVKTMDFVRAVGPDAGKTMLAIYEFRGPDEYVIVFAPAGKDRPKEMDAKAGSGTTMHVWKRVK